MHSISGSSIDGKVRARADVDVEAGAREQLHRRVLQRAFGNTESEFHGLASCQLDASLKETRRSPVWHTLPSPSRSALTSTVSSSQSTSSVADREAVPEVSPFVHSVLRVRLKKVT